jgi:hypothetical protein
MSPIPQRPRPPLILGNEVHCPVDLRREVEQLCFEIVRPAGGERHGVAAAVEGPARRASVAHGSFPDLRR